MLEHLDGIRVPSSCWWPMCMMGTKPERLQGQQGFTTIVGISGEFPPSQMSSWHQMPFHERIKEKHLWWKNCAEESFRGV